MKHDFAAKRIRLGAVYTTTLLANWVASVLVSMMESKRMAVLDPACGDGALLAALKSQGVSRLVGVDCDRQALNLARRRLGSGRFHHADGLMFLADAARGGGTLDAVIANPPWGAALTLDRNALASMGYRPLSGQTDSWDLFVDGVLRAVKPGAPIVLILPDAMFLPEHRSIREILAKDSQVRMVARLGEGFFPGVYRGVVVVAARKGAPRRNSVVACARLSPDARRKILAGRVSLASEVGQVLHRVPQVRFSARPDYRFDIDTCERDHTRLSIVEERLFPWDQWLHIGRGIELSKSGRIVQCPRCDTARPVPRRSGVTCPTCRHRWSPVDGSITTIVRKNDGAQRHGWYPLIVGQDVDRYECVASRLIRIGVRGIRYKPLATFAQPKLLVRKTGVGLKAVVDHTGAATNQVVFHFACRPETPSLILDYLAGVLCSRVMLAWHLKRQGEIEWRSHPYITPRVIRSFPVPVPEAHDDWLQVQAIAGAVRSRRSVRRHDSPEDLMVERLVAGMFRLSGEDMRWVLEVLDSVQQLEPIRTLRLPSASLVSPLRVVRGAA